jgi:signal transduction histidine kinase
MLRHEIGDFLQNLYASVVILQSRLPPEWDLEREVLARLRKRAEGCKRLLDAVQDFLCPVRLSPEPSDLVRITAAEVEEAKDKHPHLEWSVEGPPSAPITADSQRISQAINNLLTNAAEAARHRVRVRLTAQGNGFVWEVTDDGPGLPAEAPQRLFGPFFTTRPGHAGLGLFLARKLVQLHGGRIEAGNLAQGGFQVRLHLPAEPPHPA